MDHLPVNLPRNPEMPGRVVGVPIRLGHVLPILHVGILSTRTDPRGYPLVCHASRRYGETVESTLDDFLYDASGRLRLLGYPGPLTPDRVVRRAQSALGVAYDVRRRNCEHYVLFAHGLAPWSPQWVSWRETLYSVCLDPWGRP